MFNWLIKKLKRKQPQQIILLYPRWEDIWAGPVDEKGSWGCGKTLQEAIGSLILYSPEKYGIEIQKAFGNKPERPLCGGYVTIPEDQYVELTRKAGLSTR